MKKLLKMVSCLLVLVLLFGSCASSRSRAMRKAERQMEKMEKQSAKNYDRAETINKESRYWFVAVGIAPKYQGTAIHEFYTANEYQTYQGSNVDGRADVNLRIVEPGYPVAETSPTGEVVKGKMEVSPRVIKTLTIGSGSNAVTINYPEGATWSYIIKSNPDKLEKKT